MLELTQGFAYAPLQREAIRKAMTENCLVLTGGPGTGKTTTVNAILQLLEHQADRVALCAPTGRAAKRLSELTGRKASTIHRLLEVDYSGGVVSFIHNDKNLLKCDVVILDEMSMVDVKLFSGAHCSPAVQLPHYHGGRCRSAAQRGARQHSGGGHPLRAGAHRLPERDLPAGQTQPYCGERPPHHQQ